MKIYVSKNDNILTEYDGVITTLTILEEVEFLPIEEKDKRIAELEKKIEDYIVWVSMLINEKEPTTAKEITEKFRFQNLSQEENRILKQSQTAIAVEKLEELNEVLKNYDEFVKDCNGFRPISMSISNIIPRKIITDKINSMISELKGAKDE